MAISPLTRCPIARRLCAISDRALMPINRRDLEQGGAQRHFDESVGLQDLTAGGVGRSPVVEVCTPTRPLSQLHLGLDLDRSLPRPESSTCFARG